MYTFHPVPKNVEKVCISAVVWPIPPLEVARPLVSVSQKKYGRVRYRISMEFKKVKLDCDENGAYAVTPYFETNRLESMADSSGLIRKPEVVDLFAVVR